MLFEYGAQGLPFDILHHQVLFRALFISIEQLLHMRVMQAIAYLGFAPVALKDSNIAN